MTAQRVKVQGDLFHGRVPDGARYIGRAAPGLPKSPYANPYPANRYGLEHSLTRYRQHLTDWPELVAQARIDLAGVDLACWCALPVDGEPDLCHGAILLAALRTEAP